MMDWTKGLHNNNFMLRWAKELTNSCQTIRNDISSTGLVKQPVKLKITKEDLLLGYWETLLKYRILQKLIIIVKMNQLNVSNQKVTDMSGLSHISILTLSNIQTLSDTSAADAF